ncbi:MAG: hypothetical protein JO336_08090 [Acidobacteriia bacterium]|nr:hypothetical protein [Terriglobia bacterium]MBV8902224.1 hypothetical protein [Terriglobia bacterium]
MRASYLPITLTALITALPAFAHHGTGTSYDLSKPITLEGTVIEFRYANPHPQLYFDVTENGETAHWSAEFYPNPTQLQQGGWGKRRSEAALSPGTKITITLAPSRAGTKVGAILKLLNDKGEVLLGVAGGGRGEVPQGGDTGPRGAAEKKE